MPLRRPNHIPLWLPINLTPLVISKILQMQMERVNVEIKMASPIILHDLHRTQLLYRYTDTSKLLFSADPKRPMVTFFICPVPDIFERICMFTVLQRHHFCSYSS